MEKLVIIPTYNEKENIENIIRAVFTLHEGFHVLVIDDGSPDGTAQIVKQLQPSFPGQLFIEEEISISVPRMHKGCGKKLFFTEYKNEEL